MGTASKGNLLKLVGPWVWEYPQPHTPKWSKSLQSWPILRSFLWQYRQLISQNCVLMHSFFTSSSQTCTGSVKCHVDLKQSPGQRKQYHDQADLGLVSPWSTADNVCLWQKTYHKDNVFNVCLWQKTYHKDNVFNKSHCWCLCQGPMVSQTAEHGSHFRFSHGILFGSDWLMVLGDWQPWKPSSS